MPTGSLSCEVSCAVHLLCMSRARLIAGSLRCWLRGSDAYQLHELQGNTRHLL